MDSGYVNKLHWATALTILMLLMGPTGLLSFWVLDTSLPQEIVKSTLITPTVKPGRRLVTEVELVTHRKDCALTTEAFIEDTQIYRLQNKRFPSLAGSGILQASRRIPRLSPGGYVLVVNRFYECNPFHKFFPLKGPSTRAGFTVVK